MTDPTSTPPSSASPPRWQTMLARIFAGELGDARRLAGTAFVVRVAGAALAYALQVALARFMGETEYGLYAYVWTWLMLAGNLLDLGLANSAQKFIPLYRAAADEAGLRGFIAGSRMLTLAVSAVAALLLIGGVLIARPWLDARLAVPLCVAWLMLPALVLTNMNDVIARSYDWMGLALVPQFVARNAAIIAFAAGLVAFAVRLDAALAMAASALAVWLIVAGQSWMLARRLRAHYTPGPRDYAVGRWLKTSFPILLVELFLLLTASADILVLQLYRPAADVGIYFAVAKTLALVAFVHFAISAAAAHRFSALHAAGDRDGLARYLAHAVAWTFWPSLAATIVLLAVGKPLLMMFGPRFADAYPILLVLSIGTLARAAIGPVERLLNMLDEQLICAVVYGVAFVVSLALCFLLIPRWGGLGAAAATSSALVVETVLLFVVTRRRLGLNTLALRR